MTDRTEAAWWQSMLRKRVAIRRADSGHLVMVLRRGEGASECRVFCTLGCVPVTLARLRIERQRLRQVLDMRGRERSPNIKPGSPKGSTGHHVVADAPVMPASA